MTIAFWCVLIAGTLPYLVFGPASKVLDINSPRTGVKNLEGFPARCYGAHLNGFETFPLFAAVVIIAHVVRGPSAVVDVLAVLYILVRAGHAAAYLTDRQPLRTGAFAVGQLIALAIFLTPLFR
jgi:uncharacterized MAPEG superfamily protein